MLTSLTAIIREAARLLYPGRVVLGTTTSGVDSASILDSNNLANTDGHASQYDGEFVRIDEKVGSGPNVGLFRRVRDGGFSGANGDLTVEAFGTTVESGADFSLHPTLRPSELEACANRILSQAHHRAFHPLADALLANHDFEAATGGVPNDWFPVDVGGGGAPTLAQQLPSGPDRIYYGRNGMRITNTGANDYARSDLLRCNEGEVWSIWAVASGAAGTAELLVHDETNNAEIDKAVSAQRQRTELYFDFTIPAGCLEFSVRLRGVEANADVYWSPVSVFPLGRTIFALPDWVVNPHLLLGAATLPRGNPSLGSSEDNAYRGFERDPQELLYRTHFRPLHANPRLIAVSPPRAPLFIYAWRPFAELTEANTSPTTEMDHDTLIQGTLGAAHKMIAEKLKAIDPVRSLEHEVESAQRFGAYFDLLRKNDYATDIESETVRAKRVPVRLR